MPDTRRVGRFLVIADRSFTCDRVIRLHGQRWYRFMDYIYSPKPIHLLASDEIRELCEIRPELPAWAIDSDFHDRMRL